MTREEFTRSIDIISPLLSHYKLDLLLGIKDHDAEQRAEIARVRAVLKELHALVKGECPSLLNEDSGGDARLALQIEEALTDMKGGDDAETDQ